MAPRKRMKNVEFWGKLARFRPEQIEDLVEKIFTDYGRAFRPVSVNVRSRFVTVELKDGRIVKLSI